MAITSVRIHPAIGIARVGNSPDEFFIGPERPLDRTPAPGGYKDAQCRIKRQAARFRLFGYDDNDDLVKEITASDGVTITWSVHLVNKKAAASFYVYPPAPYKLRNPTLLDASRNGLIIDPGPRSITGPGGQVSFDTGTFTLPNQPPVTVPLGEIRTDTQGRLLVLGGYGNSASPTSIPVNDKMNADEWYDDVSDGPVTAQVTLDGQAAIEAMPAWVIVAPPKYAPPIDHAVTLYDRLQQFFIDQKVLPKFADPYPSYTRYVYPILHRATQVSSVQEVPMKAHAFDHPVTEESVRHAVFAKLCVPGTVGNFATPADPSPKLDMPALRQEPLSDASFALTPTQYAIMKSWSDGKFTNDWNGEPGPVAEITPEGLDMAALENCVGRAFYPGVEAGAYLLLDKNLWARAFRLNPVYVHPGDVTAQMALPWQVDFYHCTDRWWPPARPNSVTPEGGGAVKDWAAGVIDQTDFITQWSNLGFVVRSGNDYVLTEECQVPFVHLLMPQLDFKNVPRGPMGMARTAKLAIVFEVTSLPNATVTLKFKKGPAQSRIQPEGLEPVSVSSAAPGQVVHARLWLTYTTGEVGENLTDSVTVSQDGTSREWTIPITASTAERKVTAAALVLDRSGSMNEDLGDGQPRIKGLRDAAKIFVAVMLAGDAVSLVSFNQAADVLAGPATLGSPDDASDIGRTLIVGEIDGSGLDPTGQTSIGDGILKGRTTIAGLADYPNENVLIVFTDGKENHAPYIADVAATLDARTYAVGLGTPQNISASALQTISGNSGGYFLMTGSVTNENQFLLQKYFLQILAGISNAEVTLDPTGELADGESREIPFFVTEADSGMDVILLSPYAGRINFRLRSPFGEILDPARAAARSDALFVLAGGVSYYRLRLPIELIPQRPDAAGGWTALLDCGAPPPRGAAPQRGATIVSEAVGLIESGMAAVGRLVRTPPDPARDAGLRVPYSLLVHAYSDLRLDARAQQDSLEPGARVRLSAAMVLSGAPFDAPAQLWADVTRPDGSTARVDYAAVGANEYEASFTTSAPGAYAIRVQAASTSPRGYRVRREKTLTALCRHGGDPVRAQPQPSDGLRTLLRCACEHGALSEDALERLRCDGIDLAALLQCACGDAKPTGDQYPDA